MDEHDKIGAAIMVGIIGTIIGSLVLSNALGALIGSTWANALIYGSISIAAVFVSGRYLWNHLG